MVYLVTEYVEPLQINLSQYVANDATSRQQKDLFIAWGIFQTTVNIALCELKYNDRCIVYLCFQRALSFLNNDGNLQHNSVHIGSIFVNSAGGKSS